MKALAAFAMLFWVVGISFSSAQEAQEDWERFPYALGAGIEMNMDTKEGWSRGYTVGLDRHIFDRHLLAGFRGGMYNDYESVTANELSLFLRLYLFKLGLGGAFTQIAGGISSLQEDDLRRQVFLVDYTAGFRFFFLGGFYAEAAIRSGYPFRWGFSIMGGHKFSF
jgi:hypothetical protein